MRKLLAAAAVALVGAAAAWTATAVLSDSGTGTAAPTRAPAPATADITRQDLVDTETVDGTLTYADERTVTTEARGTVTWVPEEGALVKRGRSLMRVDREPVTLMYGKLPLYRTLERGVEGPDVTQLERNLKALGYGDDLTVDDEFTYATYLAVLEWQEDRGLPETGRVDAAQVVFQKGAVRIGEVKTAVGRKTMPGQEVFKVTGTKRLVHVDLDTDDQELARKGAKVTVELPGGERAKGKITAVGTVAETSGSQENQTTTVDVDITLNKKPKTRLDQAPVDVELESERVKGVLTVPVEALLATSTGGFGVEVIEGGGNKIVPVELGAFGSGRVEVKGSGLAEGMKVGVPAT
ncbi:efflux RND transporter periplasmic adaptor subunit [Nonomuraea typhae]|uniref:efflux RND transporter periplasmic adaptor subunit n=1 Tax=Nonomuraea typhae TaxID=2603600 RepID=UPI0012F7C172|nr:efflux RND transporter periplasmic adaptor subunit [Nonomuraea typhae]